ncbi:DUF1330 domain-containing protein [Paracraurococcus lichenis]|uniref:DUF1330 domain-containing protein n=1 Tax=Paracraurococcus lichenis TaxID=3064888 RepID=A0ABT9E110_9PROT|nr:DUF1330 domain-containing protein [Paracraurococcus sp. LOR1-02]MDO9709831.1 DUF1330 domain-containing protein [Paracraurococcus sp. LOR1-02]
MTAYLLATVRVTDPAGFGEYIRRVGPMIARFGGRYLVRGGPAQAVEGDPVEVVAVVEFADMPALRAFWDSPDYAPLRDLRQASAVSRIILAEGAPAA